MQESVKFNRNYYIGGSDIPAIMNISPFKSRFELLRQKANLTDDTFTGNKYTEYGNTMEPAIRDFLNKQWNDKFEESRHIVDPFEADAEFAFPIRCHLDGENKKSVLEIKTTGDDVADLVNGEKDDVVLRTTFKIYLVQTLFYMLIAKKSVGCIAVYFRPKDLNTEFDSERLRTFWFNIKEFADLVDDIKFEIRKFIDDINRLKKNPFLSEEDFLPMDLKVIANNIIQLDDVIRQHKKEIEQFEMLKSEMFKAMTNHGVESFRTENGVLFSAVAEVEPTEEIVQEFDIDRFTEEHPKLAKKYTSDKVKMHKDRKGYVRITEPKGGKNE